MTNENTGLTEDVKIIVPEEKEITLVGVKYKVGPYAIIDVIKFSRTLIDVAANIQKNYPSMEFKKEEMARYLPVLLAEVPKLIDLIAIAIDKEGEWLGKQKDLAGFSELFLAICEVNDFGAIISNFQKGWKILQTQKVRA